jgi:3-oxoacyl-[acyl-carrier protein] reductase
MNIRFEDKVVVVSGGSRGIGYAIAEAFLKAGARVIIVAKNLDRLREAAGQLALSGNVEARVCDVTDPDAVLDLFQFVTDTYERLDCVVNAAGITRDQLMIRMKDEDWHDVINANLNGIFYVCRRAARIMIRQNTGCIINISSIIGMHGNIGQANYSASKAGIIAMTKSLAREVAGKNIRVNAVAPGFIDTDMTRKLPDDIKESILKGIPLNRMGVTGDVAGIVLFLASDFASYITGQTVVVDGGMTM